MSIWLLFFLKKVSRIAIYNKLNINGYYIIKPTNLSGKENLGSMTNSWPNFPAYESLLTASFSNVLNDKEIDFSKPAQLIISHAPDMNTVYNINFSEFK